MRNVDPDILLVVEVDEAWIDAIEDFANACPRRLVQEVIPSIDASIRLDDDSTIRFSGVHPRPPQPIRGNDATARDAELTLWGQELAEEEGPIIFGGDLNDVAWSQATRLFLRTSGLLDPRRGRG